MTTALQHKGRRIAASLLEAERAYKRQDYACCAAHLRQVLKAQPDHVQALKLQAYCAIGVGDESKALDLLQRLNKVSPNDLGNRFNLAKLLVRQGRQASAVPLLQELSVAKFKDILRSDMLLAECLTQLGREIEAIPVYGRLVEQGAKFPEVFIGFAKLLSKLGQLEPARDLIEIGLADQPEHPGLLHCKALLLANLGLTASALEVFARMEGTPGYSIACELDHANVLWSFRPFEPAVDTSRALLDIYPANRSALRG
jgi:predicted Zn-dependent protease